MVSIDDLLNPEALEALKAFCMETVWPPPVRLGCVLFEPSMCLNVACRQTIWWDVRKTYIGAYWKDGFVNGLLLQVAQELSIRTRMNAILMRINAILMRF